MDDKTILKIKQYVESKGLLPTIEMFGGFNKLKKSFPNFFSELEPYTSGVLKFKSDSGKFRTFNFTLSDIFKESIGGDNFYTFDLNLQIPKELSTSDGTIVGLYVNSYLEDDIPMVKFSESSLQNLINKRPVMYVVSRINGKSVNTSTDRHGSSISDKEFEDILYKSDLKNINESLKKLSSLFNKI